MQLYKSKQYVGIKPTTFWLDHDMVQKSSLCNQKLNTRLTLSFINVQWHQRNTTKSLTNRLKPRTIYLFRWLIAGFVLASMVSCATMSSTTSRKPKKNTSVTKVIQPQIVRPSNTATPTRPSTRQTNPLGHQIVQKALLYLGVPYRYGGNDPETGLDCSGYTQLVFRKFGVELARTAADQMNQGYAVEPSQLQDGDLLFFNTSGKSVSHVGIYIGENRMVHAPSSGKSVRIDQITQKYWQDRLVGARRYFAAATSNP